MSGDYVWPNQKLCPAAFTHCVRTTVGDYWWASRCSLFGEFVGVPCSRSSSNMRRRLRHQDVAAFTEISHTTEAPALYSAVFLNPTGMGWVKNPTGPIVTMRAPYDEMLARAKQLAEQYPDSTYTVVKVCAEVRTPPKPTLEVKEY